MEKERRHTPPFPTRERMRLSWMEFKTKIKADIENEKEKLRKKDMETHT